MELLLGGSERKNGKQKLHAIFTGSHKISERNQNTAQRRSSVRASQECTSVKISRTLIIVVFVKSSNTGMYWIWMNIYARDDVDLL